MAQGLAIMSCWTDTAIVLLLLLCGCSGSGGPNATYEHAQAVFNKLFNSSVYDARIRPVNNQSEAVKVDADFEVASIIAIDDVGQRFICNGFLVLTWSDQRLNWNPKDYGGLYMIRPNVKDVWKPRVVLLNTLDERDIFEDDNSPFSVYPDGHVFWAPGGLFPTSCELDMSNYPFDEQTCYITLMSMGFVGSQVRYFGSKEAVGERFFTPNGEWELKSSNVTDEDISLDDNGETVLSSVKVSFTLKRHPTFLLLNIVLPVVFLSFLNIFVFLIPVESGEKISFGVTLLLAVSVFLSIVSGMLPRSSDVVPNVTVYLACLLVLSVFTVIASVIIVFLHNLDEQETASLKAAANFQSAFEKIKTQNKNMPRLATLVSTKVGRSRMSLSDTESLPPYEEDDSGRPGGSAFRPSSRAAGQGGLFGRSPSASQKETKPPRRNRYRAVCKYIDGVSFVVFFLVWCGLTVGFLAKMSTS